jgi:hypothetical protein
MRPARWGTSQMPPEVARLLEPALSLSVEEREALAESLISNLSARVNQGMQAAWEAEMGNRIAELDSGDAQTVCWGGAQAQLNEVAACSLISRNFGTKQPRSTMQHSSGTWSAAQMRLLGSMLNYSALSRRSRRLRQVGRLVRTRRADFCSGNSHLS